MSNPLPELNRELEEFRRRAPLAVSGAIHPKRWRAAARQRAEEILELLAGNDEERSYVKQMAAAVTVTYWDRGMGMVWELSAPSSTLAIDQVRSDETSGALFQGANREQVNRLYDWVLRWVETPEGEGGKARDERDRGRSDRVIAWGLVNLLLAGGRTGDSPENEAKRAGIIPHIQQFIDQQSAEGIGLAKLGRWLGAVANGWVEMILEQVPEAVGDALMEEWKGIVGAGEH